MCFYEPPPLLGMPDLSAAMVCALPLAVSAKQWSGLFWSGVGLSIGFLAAHFFVVALHHEFPPSFFYWIREQVAVVPISLAIIAYALVLTYAMTSFARGLWQAEYLRAVGYLLFALALLAAVVGSFLYALDAHAMEASAAVFLAINAAPPEASGPSIIPMDCIFPPFGEGVTGYSMLAVLVIFEILVAVAISDELKRKLGTAG